MFYTDAYIRNAGKVDTVKIVTLNGTDAKAEYKGENFNSAYDKQSQMFFVNSTYTDGLPEQ